MGIKDILVHVDHQRSNKQRLAIAADLARVHGAHLTGIYRVPELDPNAYLDPNVRLERLDELQRAVEKQVGAAEQSFRAAADAEGVPAEWRPTDTHFAATLVDGTHYSDLIVSGQSDPHDDRATAKLNEAFILASGRPILLVPYAGQQASVGEHVLVAWTETREAARAVHDALPILRRAEKVSVLTIAEDPRYSEAVTATSTSLCHHLARHGVRAEGRHVVTRELEISDALLSEAADLGVDLLVMGAYGHARLREVILGGATLEVLQQMTVPVFVAH